MKRHLLTGLVPLAAAVALACGSSASGPTATTAGVTPVGDAARGQALFEQHCVVCHKADASGGVVLGNVTSANLRQGSLQPTFHNDVALLTRAILDGKDEEDADLNVVMPRWRTTLTEQNAHDIIAYLETLP